MENVVIDFKRHADVTIKCPMCKKQQKMKYAYGSSTYFPYAPFCCDAMRYLDTVEWNKLLDEALLDARS